MELRQIEYFEAITRLKSYTRAAQELHVSQPSITVSIQKLEEELGVSLMQRDNKKIIITKEGQTFLDMSYKVLHDVKNVLDTMEGLRLNNKKILRLAFPSTVGSWLWKAVLSDFSQMYPDIKVEISDIGTIDIIKALKNNDIELGYGVVELGNDPDMGIKTVKKMDIKTLLPLKHKYKNLLKIPIESLSNERIIMYRKGTTYVEKRMKEEFNNAGIIPKIMYVQEQSTVYDLVSQGYGITFTLDDTVSVIQNNFQIISRPFKQPINFLTGLMWNKGKYLSTSARKLINFIIKTSLYNKIK